MERAFKMTQHGMKRVLEGTFPDGWVDGYLAFKVFGTDRYVQVTDKDNGKPIMELQLGNFTRDGIVDLTGLQVRSRFSLGGVSLDEDIGNELKKAEEYMREAQKDLYDFRHIKVEGGKMNTEEKEVAATLLKEIKDASSKPKRMGERSPREKAVSCYLEFIQASAIKANIVKGE